MESVPFRRPDLRAAQRPHAQSSFGHRAALAAQGPEFMQQYTQRLGGWLDAYTKLVADLDARASQYNMTRDAYIEALRTSPDSKVVAEANNIAQWPVILQKLEDAHGAFTEAPSWKRGLVFVQNMQRPLLEATYGDYKPAVPTTVDLGGGPTSVKVYRASEATTIEFNQ